MDIIVQDAEGKQEKVFSADLKKTILKQLEEQEIEITTACKMGMCASCLCEIVDGGENIKKNYKTEPAFPLGENEVMTCIAGIEKNSENNIILKKIF